MKKIIIYFFIGIFPIFLFAQSKNMRDSLELFTEKVYFIYDLDVISYYDLKSTYRTELLQHTFKKTNEYDSKLKELVKLKEKLFKTYYYIEIPNYFEHTNYDLKKGGFNVDLGSINGTGNLVYDDFYAKSILALPSLCNVFFPSLPIKKKLVIKQLHAYTISFFVPMNEESGVKIEKNSYTHKVLFVFKISDSVKIKYNKKEESLLKADEVKLIVLDNDNNVLFEKYYGKNELSKKKNQN